MQDSELCCQKCKKPLQLHPSLVGLDGAHLVQELQQEGIITNKEAEKLLLTTSSTPTTIALTTSSAEVSSSSSSSSTTVTSNTSTTPIPLSTTPNQLLPVANSPIPSSSPSTTPNPPNPSSTVSSANTTPSSSTSSILAAGERINAVDRLFEIASDETGTDHPLCEECTHSLFRDLDKQLRDYEEENASYNNFLSQLMREGEQLPSEQELDDEIQRVCYVTGSPFPFPFPSPSTLASARPSPFSSLAHFLLFLRFLRLRS
jgi:hypothetical protein